MHEASRVSLRVHNLLGQVVALLLDSKMEEGGYKTLEWNAGNLPSGVYFYRLDAQGISSPQAPFIQVLKMIFVK